MFRCEADASNLSRWMAADCGEHMKARVRESQPGITSWLRWPGPLLVPVKVALWVKKMTFFFFFIFQICTVQCVLQCEYFFKTLVTVHLCVHVKLSFSQALWHHSVVCTNLPQPNLLIRPQVELNVYFGALRLVIWLLIWFKLSQHDQKQAKQPSTLRMFFCGVWCVIYCPLVVWKGKHINRRGKRSFRKKKNPHTYCWNHLSVPLRLCCTVFIFSFRIMDACLGQENTPLSPVFFSCFPSNREGLF